MNVSQKNLLTLQTMYAERVFGGYISSGHVKH